MINNNDICNKNHFRCYILNEEALHGLAEYRRVSQISIVWEKNIIDASNYDVVHLQARHHRTMKVACYIPLALAASICYIMVIHANVFLHIDRLWDLECLSFDRK